MNRLYILKLENEEFVLKIMESYKFRARLNPAQWLLLI